MDMIKWERHINKPYVLKIDGDEFEIKPLGMEYLPELLKALKVFSMVKNKTDEIPEDVIETFNILIGATLDESFPEIPKEKRHAFGIRNYFAMIEGVFGANQFYFDEVRANKIKERIEQIQKAKEMQNVQANGDSKSAEAPKESR